MHRGVSHALLFESAAVHGGRADGGEARCRGTFAVGERDALELDKPDIGDSALMRGKPHDAAFRAMPGAGA